MLVSNIMTRNPEAIGASATLDDAMAAMDRLGCHHLIVSSGKRLEGVISDRDLLLATGWLPNPESSIMGRRVADIMSKDVEFATPDEEITSVAVEMMMDGIGCLPVTEGDEVVGIVTERDLARGYVSAIQSGKLGVERDVRVDQIMTKDVATVSERDSLACAADLCRQRHVRHLPVVKDGQILGILSDRDIRRARGRGQGQETLVADAVAETPLITGTPNECVSQVARKMIDAGISSVPIVDGGALVGICTSVDVTDHCMNTLWELDGPLA